MAGREGKGNFGIILGMKRQTIRGTMRRGGFRPRHLVLSSRLGAPLQRDGLGRVVVREERVHSCGETAQRLDYDSFGRVLCDTNPGFQPFGFQSGLYDPDTGLVEFGCRWYDAETGRWISKDPILLDGGWNVYAFCGNAPINRTDPSGLCESVAGVKGFCQGFCEAYADGVGLKGIEAWNACFLSDGSYDSEFARTKDIQGRVGYAAN